MPIVKLNRLRLITTLLPWGTGAAVIAGIAVFMLANLGSIQDSTKLAADVGKVRAVMEIMIGTAFLPDGEGGGLSELERLTAIQFEALDSIEPRLAVVVGETQARNEIARLRGNIAGLAADVRLIIDGERDFAEIATSYALLSTIADLDALMALLSERSGAMTIRLRSAVQRGLLALTVAATAAILTGSWFGRRAQLLRAREQATQSRYLTEENEKQKLEAFAGSLAAGLVMTDEHGTVTFANNQFEQLVGIPTGELFGIDSAELYRRVEARMRAPDEFRDELAAALDRLDEWPRIDAELAGDETCILRVISFPVLDGDGNRLGVGHLVSDVTRERAIDRMKTEFIGLASHELRTPLTGILGFSELLLAELNDPEQRRWVELINAEARHLSTIIEDLLNVSRIESGQLELDHEAVLFKEVAEHVIGAQAQSTQHHQLEVSGNGFDAEVFGNRKALIEVMSNLVDNAIKYSPDGGPVRIESVRRGGYLRVSISDEGMGIAPDQLGKIFERFHRAKAPGMEQIRGTGLGLYLVRQLVEAMSGKITVESEPGRGSTFTFTVPLYLGAVARGAA